MLDEMLGHLLRESTQSGYLVRRQRQHDSAMGMEKLLMKTLREAERWQ